MAARLRRDVAQLGERMTVDAQLPMVGWYDPAQLARTGIEVAISTVFGRHSDHRLVEALSASQRESYDYSCYRTPHEKAHPFKGGMNRASAPAEESLLWHHTTPCAMLATWLIAR